MCDQHGWHDHVVMQSREFAANYEKLKLISTFKSIEVG
jgi:hypothetical protein